jgi:hypothetical protein
VVEISLLHSKSSKLKTCNRLCLLMTVESEPPGVYAAFGRYSREVLCVGLLLQASY